MHLPHRAGARLPFEDRDEAERARATRSRRRRACRVDRGRAGERHRRRARRVEQRHVDRLTEHAKLCLDHARRGERAGVKGGGNPHLVHAIAPVHPLCRKRIRLVHRSADGVRGARWWARRDGVPSGEFRRDPCVRRGVAHDDPRVRTGSIAALKQPAQRAHLLRRQPAREVLISLHRKLADGEASAERRVGEAEAECDGLGGVAPTAQ